MVKKRNAKFPCGDCRLNCTLNAIYCSVCNIWFHCKCQNISPDEVMRWRAIVQVSPYVCSSCRTIDGEEFDHLIALNRLQQAAINDMKTLESAVRREELFNVELSLDSNSFANTRNIDAVATSIIDSFVDDISGHTIVTTGDGDCLFNAVAIALRGNEHISQELRYQTCICLMNNRERYKAHPQHRRIKNLSPNFNAALVDCATVGGYSSAWTIMALSDVIGRPIRIIYPHFNGKQDLAHLTLNTTFYPDHEFFESDTVHVLWYRLGAFPVNGSWYSVNHFAAVVDVSNKEVGTEKQRNSQTGNKRQHSSPEQELLSEWQTTKKPRRSRDFATTCMEEQQECSRHNSFEVLSDDSHETDAVNDIEPEIESTGEKLKKGKHPGQFRSNDEMISILINADGLTDKIPPGPKSDVYVLLNNERNSDNSKPRSDFPDDCGVWDSGSSTTVNQMFVISDDNSMKCVYRKNGEYCAKKVINKKVNYAPIVPPPTNIILMHRYYAKLKGNDEFKRRVTTILEMPDRLCEKLAHVAVVEYSGVYSGKKRAHGNSKTGEEYERTDPTIIHKAYLATTKSAKQTCHDMCEDDSFSAPKSSRQIQDKIYREKKKQTPERATPKNVADEILEIASQLHDNPFVQEIILTKGKQPVVILYTKEQMDDLKKHCIGSNGSVLGVDRTFNLGKCFVTSFAYKNRSVINRKTNQFPIMLGPMFLHWDGDETTYNKFFSHIRFELGGGKVTIGSDEEVAMTNAIKANFPNSLLLLCTKHLKDNIRRNLEKTGSEEKDRERIIKIIFNEIDGLVFSEDENMYCSRRDDLDFYFRKYPRFQNYWERRMEHKLKKYVYEPIRHGEISQLWTNNNSESINNRLKQAAEWKQHRLPELVERLAMVSRIQIMNLRRALYGHGDFKLHGGSKHFAIHQGEWMKKSGADKDIILTKFLNDSKYLDQESLSESKYVTSKAGNFKCVKPKASAGKKPGQRRRPRAERTTSQSYR